MKRATFVGLSAIAFWLFATATALAQPKLILTTVSSDITGDGNTVIGSILDENVHRRITTFTRGTGFAFHGPSVLGQDGRLQISDVNAGVFAASVGLYNGSFGSQFWPPSNPALFGYYTGIGSCCNGVSCTITAWVDCTGLALYTGSAACSPNPCPPVPNPPASGGCCNPTTLVCTLSTQAACIAPNYWIGNITCGNFPCSHGHSLPFRYSSTTNSWTNIGSIPENTGGAGLGATKCDGDIASPYDISANGRYITGSSWYGPFGTTACSTRGTIYDHTTGVVQLLPLIGTSAGCQNFSQGDRVSNNGVVVGRDTHASTTPIDPMTNTSSVISCNEGTLAVWEPDINGNYMAPRPERACCDNANNCTIVDPALCTGLALASTTCSPNPCPPVPNPPTSGACCDFNSLNCSIQARANCLSPNFWIGAGVCTPRNPCVPASLTILDQYGSGDIGIKVITRDGSIVASYLSSGAAEYELGDITLGGSLCKYVKNSGTGAWDRVVIGKCIPRCNSADAMEAYAISNDGNTIVGRAIYGGTNPFFACETRSFIWSTTINGGVPIDFETYVTSLNGGQPYPPTGGGLSMGQGMSADGNAILVAWTPPDPAACPPNTGLGDLSRGGVLYLNGSGIGCQPPVIAGGPYNVAQREFTRFGMVGNVFVAGSYPMTLVWQKETPTGSNIWVDLTDSCGFFTSDSSWTYEGTRGFQLRVNMLASPAARDGNYRVVATNDCGSATSAVANIRAVTGACCYNSGGNIVCSVEQGSRCTGTLTSFGFLSGTYLGDDTVCTPTACDNSIGACCFGPGGPNASCALDVVTHCTQPVDEGGLGGSFVGGGTICSPATCGSISGACCYSPDGFSLLCVVDLAERCTRPIASGGSGGSYAGNSTICSAGNTCPPGTPGVGACCYNASFTSDITCSILPQSVCVGTYTNNGRQGKYIGDATTCGPSTCRPAVFGTGGGLGACCFTDPNNTASGVICTIQSAVNCQNFPNGSNTGNTAPFTVGVGGVFTTAQCCTPSSTPPIAGCTGTLNCSVFYGACIHSVFDGSADAICTIQNQARCERPFFAGGLYGKFIGAQTVCSPAVLAANSGACCYIPFNEVCRVCRLQPLDATGGGSTRCTDEFNGGLSGTFGGAGSVCSPATCNLQEGACCLNGSCTFICVGICTLNNGTYQGDGTVCEPDPCNPQTGACCCGAACTITTLTACPTGVGTNRAFTLGGVCLPYSLTVPCCRGDYNKTGGAPTVQDIFDFLTGYFSGDACADTNDTGASVSVQDIFDFLSAYFGGC